MGWDVAQVVEYLPIQHKAVSSNPSTAKKMVRNISLFLYSFNSVTDIFKFIIHMCVHCLGHFSLLAPLYPLLPTFPRFQAEPVLPLTLILLREDISIIRKTKYFC
jgi:hypothetical protein